jgi:uncharacterized hydrophobic protein (TIGR00341 family)
MSLRLIDVFLPIEQGRSLPALLHEQSVRGIWHINLSDQQCLIQILLSTNEAEAVMDLLETKFAQVEGFQLVLLSVEAALPQSAPPDADQDTALKELNPKSVRVNRQELYESANSEAQLSGHHILMVVLSSVIAAIGLLRNDGTILIGAMVIAPLLGPNMALALATRLGDLPLVSRAIRLGLVGMSIAFSLAVLIGYCFPVNPEITEIASRTRVGWSDVGLAIASGIAGALSFASGASSAIVGVMVAVALLPPLVTFGMLLGAGHWHIAWGAMLLVLTNLVCLNLAGILTFSLQDIRPGKWWEDHHARQMTLTALWLWLALFSIVISGILLWRHGHQF